jgi:hypothetical protein
LSFSLPFLALAGVAQAAMVLDQSNVGNPSTYGGLNDTFEWQQQVTDGIGGELAGVELFAQPAAGTDTVTVSIGLGPGFYTGPFAFTTIATITPSGTFINTSAADIVLTPGEEFVIDFSGGSNTDGVADLISTYAGGDLFANVNGTVYNFTIDAGQTMVFETFIASSVPEPQDAALFGSGLIGLLGVAWVRRRRA